jgi:hypothetical protein
MTYEFTCHVSPDHDDDQDQQNDFRPMVTACASPIAIKPPVDVFTASFVFVESDVLAVAFTRYVQAMVGEECFCKSLETTFGGLRCQFGQLLFSRRPVGVSSVLMYSFRGGVTFVNARPRLDSRFNKTYNIALGVGVSNIYHIARVLVHLGGWEQA